MKYINNIMLQEEISNEDEVKELTKHLKDYKHHFKSIFEF